MSRISESIRPPLRRPPLPPPGSNQRNTAVAETSFSRRRQSDNIYEEMGQVATTLTTSKGMQNKILKNYIFKPIN